jgi:hypothetical protein
LTALYLLGMNRNVEIQTLKVSTQLMRVMGELQLYSIVSTGSRVVHGMDAMDLLCALTVRYDDFFGDYMFTWTMSRGRLALFLT